MRARMFLLAVAAAAQLVVAGGAGARTIEGAKVERAAADRLTIEWTDADPVDVYVADRPDAAVGAARSISPHDADGHLDFADDGSVRHYFLLRDTRSGATVRVAERLIPLQHGSNFRDIGGYAGAGGKHVRWGMIYRSGATPLLTDADLRTIEGLGLKTLVDLRSSEERVLAPTRIDGVTYSAVGYRMSAIMGGQQGQNRNGGTMYRTLPTLIAPQLRLIFARLLAHDEPIAYNCSAGQDRTGFVTAMILSALGVPRDTIIADYRLSTALRRPEYEMPPIDAAAQANNPIALYYARMQQNPAAAQPRPLIDADGKPLLGYAFDEIDTRWGSTDTYLQREIGLSGADIAALRATYLE